MTTTAVTHAYQDDLVVFHIGMTLHKPWRLDVIGPVFGAMPRMIRELERNKAAAAAGRAEDMGFLGASMMISGKGPWVVQYWRSIDHLYAYARNQDAEHLPVWRQFNRLTRGNPDAVGIWHETFRVPAGGIETFYSNADGIGLGGATGTVPLMARGRSARERLASSASGVPETGTAPASQGRAAHAAR